MHVIVTGAGITGSLSAWYLAQHGIEVTVIERHDGVAQEASAANAGQLAYQTVYPMGTPDYVSQIPNVLMGLDSVVRVRKLFDPKLWAWGTAFLRESRHERMWKNQDRLIDLADESHDLLKDLIVQTGIEFGFAENGRVRLYDSFQSLDSTVQDCEVRKQRYGHEYSVLTPEECIGANPLLMGREGDLAGGVLLPGDATGDTVPLCEGIRAKLEDKVRYRFNATVKRIIYKRKNIEGLELEGGEVLKADAYLFCAGADSPELLKRAGVKLNMYPVKGCSVIFEDERFNGLLKHNITDATRRIVLAPMRGAVKLSTGMVFAGNDKSEDAHLVNYLRIATREMIPALDFNKAKIHTGLRPAMPDSIPVVKRAGESNIYLNTGHGMWGWLLAPVTAKHVADLIVGAKQ